MTKTKQEPVPLTPSQAMQKGYTHFFMEDGGFLEPLTALMSWVEQDIRDRAEYEGIAIDDYTPSRPLFVAEKNPHYPSIDGEDITDHIAEQLIDRSLAEDPDSYAIDAVLKDFKERIDALAADINKAVEDAKIDGIYLGICPLNITRHIISARQAIKRIAENPANV